MRLRAALGSLALLFFAQTTEAALTSSEKGQIKDFVVAAKVENAHRVRSLVARTDLSQEETIAVLSESVGAAPFSAERAAFLRELVFGQASAASRPLLAHAVTRAVLARADAVHQKYVGGLDHEPKAVAELVAIYGFLDRTIADAGTASGITPAAYDQCGKAMRDHVDQNARWLKGDAPIAESANRLRAQAQVTLFDMIPEGLTRRVDAADRLGLRPARKKLLVDTGIVLADSGKLDETKVGDLRALLARLPFLREGLEVLVVGGDDKGPPIVARGGIGTVGAPGGDKYPFGAEVTEGKHEPQTSAVLLDLSVLAARRALARTDFRDQVAIDAANVKGDTTRFLGRPRGPGLDHVLGAAIHALLVDTSRAVDSSFLRMMGGKPEAAALLSDAIGALAVPGDDKKLGVDGQKKLADVQRTPNGAAIAFVLDGKKWGIDRTAPSYAVTGATIDGRVVTPADLATAKTAAPKK
jgi:hypothetical protein